jgi:hypothetical protein
MKIENMRDPLEKNMDYEFLDLDKEPISSTTEFSGVIVYEANDYVADTFLWIIEIDALEGKIAQKYSVLHFPAIKEFMNKNQIADTNQLLNYTLKFERKKFRMGYDRFVPVKILECNSIIDLYQQSDFCS